MKKLIITLTVTLSLALSATPEKIIFDTDMYTDFDDVGALCVLHALADAGECEILATISSSRDTPAVGICELINDFYGRSGILVGALKKGGVGPLDPAKMRGSYPIYQAMVAKYADRLRYGTGDKAPDALEVYRRVLAGQPDGSVTICSVGFLTNLADLLRSKADGFSSLDGKTLVARKVKAWYAMACRYPDGKEYNAANDAASSRYALDEWPTPVYFVDWWLGGWVRCGIPLSKREGTDDLPRDILRLALAKYKETEKGHAAWDQVAALAAVRGFDRYLGAERGRFRITQTDGRNEWIGDGKGLHRRLFAVTTQKELGHIIDELMARPPQVKTSPASVTR